ncbi:MAG: hypothetical protein KJ622_01525 [Alphaproteobacteria bacterium]|nr:hypothetical protein [Alphaproteobacteria bacterium]
MEDPVFRVYIAQTPAVKSELLFLEDEDVQSANFAVKNIAENAVRDTRCDILRTAYFATIDYVTVGARVRREANKIYIILVFLSTDGDWDPDGCDGLDDLGYSQCEEIAKAFVTFIGGRPCFRWINRGQRRRKGILDSDIAPASETTASADELFADRHDGTPSSIADSMHLYVLPQTATDRRLTFHEKSDTGCNSNSRTRMLSNADIFGTNSIFFRKPSLVDWFCEPQSHVLNSFRTDKDARLIMLLGTSLPPGIASSQFSEAVFWQGVV